LAQGAKDVGEPRYQNGVLPVAEFRRSFVYRKGIGAGATGAGVARRGPVRTWRARRAV